MPVPVIGQKEHGSRQHRRAVCHDPGSGIADRKRGSVVRVHAHSSCAEDQIRPCIQQLPDGRRDLLVVVAADLMADDLHIIFRQLFPDHRGKGILNPPVKHLVSGGHNPRLQIRHQLKDQLLSRRLLCPLHLLLLDHQRNDPGSCQLVPRLHRNIPVPRRNHHLSQGVDRSQPFGIHLKQPGAFRAQLNLAFLHL